MEFLRMVDWVPVAFLTFKVLIFGACMFFAIKWHYDQGNKVMDRRALIRRGSKFFAIFILALVCVLALTFGLSWKLGMDLRLP